MLSTILSKILKINKRRQQIKEINILNIYLHGNWRFLMFQHISDSTWKQFFKLRFDIVSKQIDLLVA